jgi:hypothetical protein
MSTSVSCIAPDEPTAGRIVDALRRSGFEDDRISALVPDTSASPELAHEGNPTAPEGNIVIAVHMEDADDVGTVREILETLGGQDISVASDSRGPDDQGGSRDRHPRGPVAGTPATASPMVSSPGGTTGSDKGSDRIH